jgi:hypothetical protein
MLRVITLQPLASVETRCSLLPDLFLRSGRFVDLDFIAIRERAAIDTEFGRQLCSVDQDGSLLVCSVFATLLRQMFAARSTEHEDVLLARDTCSRSSKPGSGALPRGPSILGLDPW